MATSSTLGLLFEISADPSKATAAVQGFAAETTAALGGVQSQGIAGAQALDGVGIAAVASSEKAAQGAGHMVSSQTEARHAIRGLGEEIGVHMPRFVSSYLTSLGPVAGVMASAFSAIAIIGIIQVLGQVPAAVEKIIGAISGWDKEAQKAYEDLLKWNQEQLKFMEELAIKQRELNEIGLTGSAKAAMAQENEAKTLAGRKARLAELGPEIEKLNTLVEKTAHVWSFTNAALGAAVEDAKTRLPILREEYAKLQRQVQLGAVAQEKSARELTVDLGKEEDERGKKAEEAAKKNAAEIARILREQAVTMEKVEATAHKNMIWRGEELHRELKKEQADWRAWAEFQIEMIHAAERESKEYAQEITADWRMIEAARRLDQEEGDKHARQAQKNDAAEAQSKKQLASTAIEAIGETLMVEAGMLKAVSLIKAIYEGAEAIAAAARGDWKAAGLHALAATKYGFTVAQAGGSSRASGASSAPSSAGAQSTPAEPPAMAPGAVSGAGNQLRIVIVSGDASSRAALAEALNQHTRFEGGQIFATRSLAPA